MPQTQRFTRSINDRVLAGVVGGIAHRFGWNPTLLRAIYVIISVASAAFPGRVAPLCPCLVRSIA